MLEEIIQLISDWHAFWLLVEWVIFTGLIVIGISAWLILKVLTKN